MASKTRSVTQKDEQPDDNWQLPLPNDLQAIVDSAPTTRAELDEYFKTIVDRTWSDPAARMLAVAVYFENPVGMSTKHLPREMRRNASFFAAEMRVIREKCRR